MYFTGNLLSTWNVIHIVFSGVILGMHCQCKMIIYHHSLTPAEPWRLCLSFPCPSVCLRETARDFIREVLSKLSFSQHLMISPWIYWSWSLVVSRSPFFRALNMKVTKKIFLKILQRSITTNFKFWWCSEKTVEVCASFPISLLSLIVGGLINWSGWIFVKHDLMG